MKKVVVYQAYVGEQLKFASIDYGEVSDYCQVLYDSTGVLATIENLDYQPVDHTNKTSFIKYGEKDNEVVEETYR